MKKILLMALVSVCLAAVGCSDSDDKGNGGDELELAKGSDKTPTIYADELTSEGVFGFTANSSWTSSIEEKGATRAATWVSISPSSGDAGTYSIDIILETNYTGKDRTAEISINCGNSTIAVTVTQKATKQDGTIPDAPRLLTAITESATIESNILSQDNTIPPGRYSYHFDYDDKYRVKKYTVKDTEDRQDFTIEIDYSVTGEVSTKEYGGSSKGLLNEDGYIHTVMHSYDNDEPYYYLYNKQGYLTRYEDTDHEDYVEFIWSNGNLTSIESYWEREDGVYPLEYSSDLNNKTSVDLNAFFFGFIYPNYLYDYPRTETMELYAMAGLMGRRSTNYALNKMDPEEPKEFIYGGMYTLEDEPELGQTKTEFFREFDGKGEYKFDAQNFPISFSYRVKVREITYKYEGKKEYYDNEEDLPLEDRYFNTILEKSSEVVKYDRYTYTISYND